LICSISASQLFSLFLDPAGETIGADDGAFVQAAHDDLAIIAGFDLELDLDAIHGDDPGSAMDGLTDGRGREMPDVDLNAHGPFIGFEVRGERVARCAFEELDDVGSGYHGGHAVAVKFHDVLHIRGDMELAKFTYLGA
jgi:hypothetical protein